MEKNPKYARLVPEERYHFTCESHYLNKISFLKSTTTPKKGGLNCDPKRVKIMNCYFTTETQIAEK